MTIRIEFPFSADIADFSTEISPSLTDPILQAEIVIGDTTAPAAWLFTTEEARDQMTVTGPDLGAGNRVTMQMTGDFPDQFTFTSPPSQSQIDAWYAEARMTPVTEIAVTEGGDTVNTFYTITFLGDLPTAADAALLNFADLLAEPNEIILSLSSDIVLAGRGADTVEGSEGADTLAGGLGSDLLKGSFGGDDLSGGQGQDTLLGQRGNDLLLGQAKGDSLVGGAGRDTLFGGTGSDTLSGGSGRDLLTGGTGADSLGGGTGRDTLSASRGADTLEGGAGSDTFLIDLEDGSGPKRIVDFNLNRDTLVLDVDAAMADIPLADFLTDAISFGGVGAVLDLGTLTLRMTGLVDSDLEALIDATSYQIV